MQLMECPGDKCTYFQEFGFCCDGCIRNGYYHDKLNFGIIKHKNIAEYECGLLKDYCYGGEYGCPLSFKYKVEE